MRRREQNKALHKRLEAWGDRESRPVRGLGYRSQTTEAEMMEMGQVCRSGNAAVAIVPEFTIDKKVAEVEAGIQAMNVPEWKRAIESKYLHRHRGQEIQKYCGQSKKQFYINLKNAEAFMCGWLGYQWED